MYSRHHRKVRVVFALADIALLVLAFEAAYHVRGLLTLEGRIFFIEAPLKVLLEGAAIAIWLVTGLSLQVYDQLGRAGSRTIVGDTLRQWAIGSMGLILIEYLARLDLSRAFVALFAAFALIVLTAFRLNARRFATLIRREFGASHFAVIVGRGERAESLRAQLERSADSGVRIHGIVDQRDAPEHLPTLLRKQIIDEVLFAVDSGELAPLEELFLLCDEEGVRTRVALDFFPHVNSDVFLDRLGTAPLLTFSAAPHDEVRLLVKRSTDFAAAAGALLLLSPIMLIVALTIRLTSRGPAIFRQVRCGLNGRTFMFYKFRSMVDNAEQLKESLEHLNERQTAFKISNDPRLTGVGRWLRKFSIDEWPQFWNVLKGDMSLVGPRPAVPQEVERYQRWQRRRLRMRPGLTCLWALSGRDRLDFETWMRLDMQYIDNWSLALDLKILLKTVPQVIAGRGAS